MLASPTAPTGYSTDNGCHGTDSRPRVPASPPRTVWPIATIELCERFAFFGVVGPMQNYAQNAVDDPLRRGGLGLGQAKATMLNQSFLLWCYITPIIGAVVADQYLGRVKTIFMASALYVAGLLSLCLSASSAAQNVELARLTLVTALFLIGIGAGGIKTNVSALIAEQYTESDTIRINSSGEEEIVDRDLTLQRIFLLFFLFINVGSLSASVCTVIEQRYGFTLTFATSTLVFVVGFVVLLSRRSSFITSAPQKSIILHAGHALWLSLRRGGGLQQARPDAHPNRRLPWDDAFIDDLGQALSACKLFLLYPFYWAACSQFATSFVSQAATMETGRLPSDALVFLDPVTTITLLPVLDRVVFPYFQRRGSPITYRHRVTAGFLLCAASMLYAATVQTRVYAAPPCYDRPRARECMGGAVPNQVSVYWQVPAYVLGAASAVMAAVAAIEYAYTRAPASMKSLIMAIYLSTTSLGSLLAVFVTPLTHDPLQVCMYVTLAVGPLAASLIVWVRPQLVQDVKGDPPVQG